LAGHGALGEVADDVVPVGVLGEQASELGVEVALRAADDDGGVAEAAPAVRAKRPTNCKVIPKLL